MTDYEDDIDRFESEGGSPKTERKLKMEEIPVIDLLEGDKNAQKQERDEKHKESGTVRET